MKISILGAGSFGTAVGILLTDKGNDVTLWSRNRAQADVMQATRGNHKYLPGILLPENLKATWDFEKAVREAELLVFAVPAQSFGEVFREACRIRLDFSCVNLAKGIEKGSLRCMSEIARDAAPEIRYACLSGPSHAEEVARFLPTTVVAASEDPEYAREIQRIFMTEYFRVYTNTDMMGVELGGALKNIIALGAGISDGIGLGDNAKAAIMTRGIAEMKRLGLAMGASQETFSGLTGIGDLIVTCTSMHSRNRRCGIMMGQGMDLESALRKVGMVVEGVSTCEAAYQLSQKYDVEMPITGVIHDLLNGRIACDECVGLLMARKEKHE